jgi:DNA gyrase/topoisomerase IV subunit A
MDRFGYARIVDVAVYERNKEAADSENKYIVHCMNTGKICIFTNSGKMHQVKVIDLPYGKYRLASASSVQAALKGLLEKDFVTQEMGICQIYDRFLGIWLKENY